MASTTDKSTRYRAIESLGKIGLGNEIAIAALVELIASTTDKSTRRQAAESLEKMLTKSLMPKVVNPLKNSTNEEAVKVLWNCAQNLTYPEFYSAWHKSRSC
jgi:HEAT repeat protein